MKIAYFSPLSPIKSGISDYSEKELIPYLKKYFTIDIYIDDYVPTNAKIIKEFKIFNYKNFPKHLKEYDHILYQMGNNQFHTYMYDYILKYSGFVVLHDIFLHGMIWSKTLDKGDKKGYITEFEMYGAKGKQLAESIIATQNFRSVEFKLPFLKRILKSSKGIIVHSDFGKNIALREYPDVIIKKIHAPIIPLEQKMDKAELRKTLALTQKNLIIGVFGFVYPHKRIPTVLKAFFRFNSEYPDSTLLIVGEDNINLKGMIKSLGVKSVIQTGHVSFQKMYEYMQVSDICVNLRYPTAGETSASLLRLLSLGKPVIVSNVGWFSELPDYCCVKVDIDNFEVDLIVEYLKALALNEKLRKKMGENAKEYAFNESNPEKIAYEYSKFICAQQLQTRENHKFTFSMAEPSIIQEISNDMADIGLGENDTSVIKDIAIALKELGILR